MSNLSGVHNLKISSVGGIIAAANSKLAFPLKKVGTITAVKRIALLLKQAGVFPIVVLTGPQEDKVRYQLAEDGVIFLPVGESPLELIESAKIGFSFLQDLCDKVVFAPVNAPFFSAETMKRVLEAEGDVVIPSFQKRGGHPIVLTNKMITPILNYSGAQGLNEAIVATGTEIDWVNVDDSGIRVHAESDVTEEGFHLINNLGLEQETVFFTARVKLLLFLISQTHAMRGACDLMALSYSKGWALVNQLEKDVGFIVVARQHGGKHGGRTDLTAAGYDFLIAYQKMEETIIKTSQAAFRQFVDEIYDR